MKKSKKAEKPEVARIVIEVLVNRVDSLPTDEIVAGLDFVPVLSCYVETVKGKKLKGSLLKDANEALDTILEEEADEEADEEEQE